ncbi:MAG: NAD(P)-dependent oxidoreductase [Halieaceae bacterium]|nr:NAD(P)-dependent oxidoreductase [Halieaceae bacterium]
MTSSVTVLAMHPQMRSLFPNPPQRWQWIQPGENIEAIIDQHGSEVEILLSASIEKLDKAMLARFPNLRMIASISAGFSNIDLQECRSRGIAVTNAPGMNSGDVADLASTLLTSLLLRLPQSQSYIMNNQWVTQAGPLRHSLRNMPVGIVGLGAIGRELVKRLTPFGFRLKWWGPRAKPNTGLPYVETIEALADESCGLIVCCRPDESNRHLINKDILDRLGSDGVLVNVSRGSLVDESALINALRSGRLGGAALDVFDPEPTSAARWNGVPNVILTPHQGGSTHETLFAQAKFAQSNIENFLDGEPLHSSVL